MADTAAPGTSRRVLTYDFQRHEAMDRSRLRRLTPVLEVGGHRATQALTSIVRTSIRVEVGELEQKRWEVFSNSLPEPTFLATAVVTPMGGRVAFHAPLDMAFAVIEQRLGGVVTGVVPDRALSDVESRLFGEVAEGIITGIFQSFNAVVPMSTGPLQSSSSALLVQMPNPSEVCLLVNLKISIEDNPGYEASMTLPLSTLLTLLDALERIERVDDDQLEAGGGDEVRERVLDVPVDVAVAFPEIVLSADELLSLSVGDVISLKRPEGLPLDLNVDGQKFYDVVPTTKGKRLACMVVAFPNEED